MDLSELLERVEKASGPDRELDAAIICGLYPACEQHTAGALATEAGCYWRPMSGGMTVHTAEPLTASLDAALALVERLGHDVQAQLLAAIIILQEERGGFNLKLLPMAICTQLLRTVIAGNAELQSDAKRSEPMAPQPGEEQKDLT